ncbi:MAG TPA: hypothetical protein VGH90_13750 [Chthoniobacteraceae bacterium]|jgi:hypothetical protein
MKKLLHLLSVPIAVFSLSGMTAIAALSNGPAPSVAFASPPAGAAPATAAGEDIIDIRGPMHIPAEPSWLAWLSSGLAVSGLGFGIWTLLRRPRRKLPYELALEQLEQLRPLMRPESAHAFSFGVSEIVRLFVEKCFPVRAAHRTTDEFLHDLVKLPGSPLAAHRETLGDFLSHCDLAKFARWSLTAPQMEAMLASASAFIIAIGKPRPAKKKASPPAPQLIAEPQALAAPATINS